MGDEADGSRKRGSGAAGNRARSGSQTPRFGSPSSTGACRSWMVSNWPNEYVKMRPFSEMKIMILTSAKQNWRDETLSSSRRQRIPAEARSKV